tara:strand:- start:1521 stop:2042 length:522 start_codon:yes stop_codon:yes gene_type:complete
MNISTTLDGLLPVAGDFNTRHHQSIADNVSNKNLIEFVQENSDPAAVDSLTEILAQAQNDKTSVLSIVSTLEAKHDAELVAAKLELNTSIAAANTKHDAELAVEVQARLDAVSALETKHDAEKVILDAAILAESTARAAEKVITDATHAADKAETSANLVKVGAILTEAFKAV